MPSPDPVFATRVGRSGFLFYFGEGQCRSQGLFLYKTWSREKKPLSATIIIINSDKALVDQHNEEYDLTSELQTLWHYKMSLCWFIVVRFIRVMYTRIVVRFIRVMCKSYIREKSKCSRGCCFYVMIFFDICLLFS